MARDTVAVEGRGRCSEAAPDKTDDSIVSVHKINSASRRRVSQAVTSSTCPCRSPLSPFLAVRLKLPVNPDLILSRRFLYDYQLRFLRASFLVLFFRSSLAHAVPHRSLHLLPLSFPFFFYASAVRFWLKPVNKLSILEVDHLYFYSLGLRCILIALVPWRTRMSLRI